MITTFSGMLFLPNRNQKSEVRSQLQVRLKGLAMDSLRAERTCANDSSISPSRSVRSLEDLGNHVPRHVGESEVAAAVAVGEALVGQAQKGQESGVQVGGVHAAFDGVQAVFISSAVRDTLLDAGAGQPHGVAGNVVIATIGTLCGRHAAKLAAEQD